MKVFTIYLLLVSSFVYGQDRVIDSLRVLLKKAKNDTSKCKFLYEIAELASEDDTSLIMTQLDSAITKGLRNYPNPSQNRTFFIKTKAAYLNTVGCNYNLVGEFKKALPSLEEALSISDTTKNLIVLSSIYGNMATAHSNLGHIQEAIRLNKKSMQIREAINDEDGLGYSYVNLSAIYQDIGDYPQSIMYAEKGLKLREKLGDLKNTAVSLNNLGTIYDDLGDPAKALEYYETSVKMREKVNDKKGLTSSYLNIGLTHKNSGNNAKAMEYYEKSLKLCYEVDDKSTAISALNNIGSIYDDFGNIDKAVDYYTKGLNLAEQIGEVRSMAVIMGNLGIIYRKNKQYDKALEIYNRSLEIYKSVQDKRRIAVMYNNIAMIHKHQRDYTKALGKFNESLKIRQQQDDKNGIGNSYQNLAIIYFLLGEHKESLECAYKSLKYRKALNFPFETKISNLTLGQTYIRLNKLDSAESYMKEAILTDNKTISNNFSLFSEVEKENFLKTIAAEYSDFNAFALLRKTQNPSITEIVYNNTIQNKGLLLKSSTAMRQSVLRSKDTSLQNTYSKWITLKKQIAQLYAAGKDLKEKEEEANNLEKILVKKSSTFSDFEKAQDATWKTVRKKLVANEAAVEFINFRKETLKDTAIVYCALIVKTDSKYPEMIELFKEEELQKIIGKKTETSYEYITGVYGTKNKSKSNLYDLIWKPIEKNLKGIKTVYYSPSGLLHKISFAALNSSQNSYLCDNYRLEYESSTGKVTSNDQLDLNKGFHITLFGGIEYETSLSRIDTMALLTWPYLEGTKTETDKIAAVFKSSNISYEYIQGEAATEEQFKQKSEGSNILHIATHGFFFPGPEDYSTQEKSDANNKETRAFRSGENAVGIYNFLLNKNSLMRSGLAFAGANEVWSRDTVTEKEDGVLTAQEAVNLNLTNTRLLVLSACETGLGDIKGSEGVYGLQRAFKMAGVQNIIMSLWQVPDAETVEFMHQFYSLLTKTKNVKQSFYQTQNYMRQKFDPFFWAAFVLLE